MSPRSIRAIAVACTAAWLAVAPAQLSAQEVGAIPLPAVEVSAGYAFMRDFSDVTSEDINFPLGWYLSTTGNVNHWFGIVGEVSGAHKNDFDIHFEGVTFTNKARIFTFMGGPRFARKSGRLMPFGQFLVGGANIRVTTGFPAEVTDFGEVTVSTTEFAFQPGGGMTIFLNDRIGIRMSADYRCIVDFDSDGNSYANELRVATGFSFHWGAR